MKRIVTLILALIMIFALTACGEKGGDTTTDATKGKESGKADVKEPSVKFIQVEEGLALDEDGRIWSFSLVEEPKVFCDAAKFTYISEGNGYKCALDENGGLWTWGSNKSGQLGDGTTTDSDTPKKVLDDVKMVSGFYANAFAIKNDGTLYQWGYGNTPNKIGYNDSNRDNILTPTPVSEDIKFQYVSAGTNGCVAIDTNGTRYAWGAYCTILGYTADQIDSSFSANDAVIASKLLPISNDTAPKGTYYFGSSTTYLIDSNNTLYISGGKGSKLDPFETNASFGKFTKAIDKVSMLVPSTYGTLYIDTDGNIWGWGSDAFKFCSSSTPVQLTKDIEFVDVAILDAGTVTAYALGADGNIYTFGEKGMTPTVLEVK